MKKHSFITMILLIFMLSISSPILAQTAPEPDRDGDGVADNVDRCISDFGPASNNGCPEANTGSTTDDNSGTGNDTQVPADIPPDSDGDGTADPLDLCPTVQGDGANGGCPEGYDPNAETVEAQDVAPTLLSAPVSDSCLVSPSGLFGVNIRIGAHPDADSIHVLQLNEWATVLGASYQADYPPFEAEHEPASLSLPLGVEAPSVNPDPDPIDDFAVNKPIWLLIETNDGFVGWVNQSVVRYGGDCSELVLPDDDIEVLEMIFMPADGNSVGFPNDNPFISFPVIPDPMPTFEFDIVLPTDTDSPSLDLRPECIYVEQEVGVFVLECADGNTPTIMYCVTQLGSEAGIYEDVCFEIEIPEGCTVETLEAGVWSFDCEEDNEVNVTVMGDELPILNIRDNRGGVLVGLLLPAVQQVREAARR